MILRMSSFSFLFFFNDTAPTEIYTLSLHDALPISQVPGWRAHRGRVPPAASAEWSVHSALRADVPHLRAVRDRSEEHTSELQSPVHLVCRLLLEKKKKDRLIDCIPV